jgi:large subunit ribosomal protein L10
MPKSENINKVEEIKKKLEENPNFIVTEYRGLTVQEMNEMRSLLREKGILYQVYKNTLFRIALEDVKIEGVDQYFYGPVGVAFSKSDVISPCKILSEFAKKSKKLKIKGGYSDGTIIKEDEITQYASMPTIEEMYSTMLRTLMNPATRLVKVLSNPIQKLAMALNQIADKK